MQTVIRHLQVFLFSLSALFLYQCANQTNTPDLTEITIFNTGSYEMLSPLACYYENTTLKECVVIDSTAKTIQPNSNYNFFIQANQKIRLVFPFDTIHKSLGVMYRPNCHILADFFSDKEKRYIAKAQITTNLSEPENGFNCGLEVFEQNLGETIQTNMNDNLTKHSRYRVPRSGEVIKGYISNYHWQETF